MQFKDAVEITSRYMTDEGYLVVDAIIARVGIQEYYAMELGLTGYAPDAVINVYRPPEEVFDEESMRTFEGKPVTNNHPPVFVDTSNIKQYQVGHVIGPVVRDGNFLKTRLMITDANAIELINSGKVELSNGYVSDYVENPGRTMDGLPFVLQQIDIRGNHVAIVEKGRCGGDCKILDMAKITDCGCNGGKMKQFVIDKKKISVRDEDAQEMEQVIETLEELQSMLEQKQKEIDELKARIESMTKEGEEATDEVEELTEKNEELNKTVDRLKAQVDELKSNRMTDSKIQALVAERIKLRDTALRIVPNLDCASMTAKDIKLAVIKSRNGQANLDGKSDDYINARFDAIVEMIPSALDEFGKSASGAFHVDSMDEAAAARQEMIKRNQDAWKGGK